MYRRIISTITIFLSLLCYTSVSAIEEYKYQDPKNRFKVEELINEVYTTKQQYIDLFGTLDEDDESFIESGNLNYWWPIGSVETTTVNGKTFANDNPETTNITSYFGYRILDGKPNNHSGLDISGGRGLGQVNIIAAKDGIVVYPNSLSGNDCPSRSALEDCHGSGYGNYVVIQHSDGNYTLYGHLYENSILVKAGDSVSQGQVIAKMGSSGRSTGAHLHFEVRVGQNAYKAASDPLDYIDPKNPRPVSSGGEDLLAFLAYYEGSTGISGDSYKVIDIGDGELTVGHGVTLRWNADKFQKYGINVNNYRVGSYIPISIVDKVQIDVLNESRTYIEGVCAKNSISLKSYQIDALVILKYQAGNINGFVDNYRKYGESNELFEKWWKNKGIRSGFEKGLSRRRSGEWRLFTTGNYKTGD